MEFSHRGHELRRKKNRQGEEVCRESTWVSYLSCTLPSLPLPGGAKSSLLLGSSTNKTLKYQWQKGHSDFSSYLYFLKNLYSAKSWWASLVGD